MYLRVFADFDDPGVQSSGTRGVIICSSAATNARWAIRLQELLETRMEPSRRKFRRCLSSRAQGSSGDCPDRRISSSASSVPSLSWEAP